MSQMYRTVLVIEDAAATAPGYRSQLSQESDFFHQIYIEPYGDLTLNRCRTLAVDGVLLDLAALPNRQLSFIRQLEAALGDRGTPIVAIGSSDVKEAVQALKGGAADYLVWDQMTAADLCLTLRSAIENAELKRRLEPSRVQFETSVENMMDCFGIYTAIRDVTGQIIDFRIDYVNQAACESNHMSREQQVGQRLCQVLPGHVESGLFEDYCRLVETGVPVMKDSLVYEDTFGGGRQLVRAFDIRASKFSDGFVVSWRDITERKQLELQLNYTVASLQQEAHRLKYLIAQAPIGIGIGSPSGEVKMINDAMLHLYGIDREIFEQQGLHWHQLITPEQAESAQQALVELRQTGRFSDPAWIIMQPGGQQVPMWMSAQQLRDGTDDHVMFAVDLTQLKQVEASLQESQNQLQAELAELENIYQSAPIGLCVLDRDLRFRRINQRLADINGYPIAAHIGRTVREVLAELADTAEALLRSVLETGEPLLNVELQGETPAQPGVQRAWLENFLPIKHGDQVIGINIVCEEITDQQRYESERREREAELQQALQKLNFHVENSPLGVIEWDAEMRVSRWSRGAERIFGWSAEEVLGKQFDEFPFVFPDDVEAVARLVDQYCQGLVTQTRTSNRNFTRDGMILHCEWYNSLLRNETGQMSSLLSLVLDVTEEVQAQQEIAASEKRFRLMAETIENVFWISDLRVPKVLYISPAFETIWGISPDVILQQPDVWLETIHPDDRDRVRQLRNQKPIPERIDVEFRIVRPDGEIRWICDRGFTLRDESGVPQQTVGIAQDITVKKQTELDLRAATERLNLALKSAPITLFNQDHQLRYTWVHNSIAEFAPDRLIGRHDSELLDPATATYLTQLKQQVLDTGVSLREEVAIPHAGQVLHFDATIDPIWDDQNTIVGITVASVDISHRVRAEAALRANEQLLRLAMAGANAGSWDWEITTGKITWSRENCDLYGLDFGQQAPMYADWFNAVHPDDRDRSNEEVRCVIEQRLPEFRSEFRIIHPQRGVRWLLGLGRLTLDAQGNPIRLSGINLDITERKQAEQCLRESEERLQLGVQVAGLALARFDYATNQVELSPEAATLYGLDSAQRVVPLHRLHATFHPDDQAELQQLMAQVLNPAGSGWLSQDHRIVWPNGNVRWLSVRKRVFFDYSRAVPQPVYGVLAAIDITDRKTLELQRERLLLQEQTARAAAERANRVKDEFLAILSHELRSPLNPILGWSRLLQTKEFDSIRRAQALATIERNAKLQAQLIDDLLDVARILRGKLKLKPRPVNLTNVITAALDIVGITARTKAIQLHFHPPQVAFPLAVMGDAVRLQQIIWNLLSNAIKFTPSGGRVEVRLGVLEGTFEGTARLAGQTPESVNGRAAALPPTGYAEITVTDTGQGITPDFLPHIFESFRQEDVSITREHGGLGLGLSIVRYLVEAHAGTITAQSPGEGLGATFTVRLPLISMGPLAEGAPPVPQRLSLKDLRVLAVDDDGDTRHIVEAILTYYGAEVVMVATAAEVMEQLPQFRPHVLVCDLGMPEMDGYSLMHQVRNLLPEQGGLTPAIALTAYARVEDQQRTLESGYQQHIAKPFDLDMLVSAIAELALPDGADS